MRLARLIKWSLPLAAVGVLGFQSRPRLSSQKEQVQRREVKVLSKTEFLSQMVNNQQSHALLVIFETSHLRKAEAQEKERKAIQLAMDLASIMADNPNVRVSLFRKEDYEVLRRSLESTAKKDMPFKLVNNREVYLIFKRADYQGFFDMNDQPDQATMDAVRSDHRMTAIRKAVDRLADPVTEVRTEDDLRQELVRHVGINDRPVILDVCRDSAMKSEKERLTQYLLSRFEQNLIARDTTALLIDEKALPSSDRHNTIGVIKNDFKTLYRLSQSARAHQAFSQSDPVESARAYSSIVRGIADDVLQGKQVNFSGLPNGKSTAVELDSRLQPDIPLFLHDDPFETTKFFTHLYNSGSKKVLSLNLLKDDPQTEQHIDHLMEAAQSEDLQQTLSFQLFAEGSHERVLKHLNKFYSPFCLFDLAHSDGHTYQKLFVPHRYGSSYTAFESALKSALAKASRGDKSDVVMFSEDSIESLSSKGLEFYMARMKSKTKIVLLLKPQGRFNLLYERHLLEKFGHKDSVKVARLDWPNTVDDTMTEARYPSLLVKTPHADKAVVLDLPADFASGEELGQFLAVLDSNLTTLIDGKS